MRERERERDKLPVYIFILAVCHFLKWVTPSRFDFATQGEL